MKRKKIDKEISKMVYDWLKANKQTVVSKVEHFSRDRIRKGVLIAIDPFEKEMDKQIQIYAHKKIPSLKTLGTHADRHDFKISLRKHMRRCIVDQLGYQKYFPELYEVKK